MRKCAHYLRDLRQEFAKVGVNFPYIHAVVLLDKLHVLVV